MTTKKRITIVFWGDILPADMGNKVLILRLAGHLRRLQAYHLTLLTITKKSVQGTFVDIADEFIQVRSPNSFLVVRIINKLLNLMALNPLRRDWFCQWLVRDEVYSHVRGSDCVILNYISQHYLIKKEMWPQTVVLTHDLFFYRLESFLQKNLFKNLIVEVCKKMELELLGRARAVLVVADYEKALLQAWLPEKRIELVGIPQLDHKLPVAWQYEYDFLFVGGKSRQNILALHYFINRVYDFFPEKTFCITGNITTISRIRDYVKKYPKIVLIGFTDSLEEIYSKSRFAVGTVTVGSGVKVKVLEAMSYGKVVISNNKGLEGIHAMHGIEVINLDKIDFQEFKILLEKLYTPQAYSSFAKAAKSFIAKNYSMETCFRPVIQLLSEIE